MTKQEAKRVKVGDQVKWHSQLDGGSDGEVVDTGYAGFQVRWHDERSTVSTFLYTDPNDRLQYVARVKPPGRKTQ